MAKVDILNLTAVGVNVNQIKMSLKVKKDSDFVDKTIVMAFIDLQDLIIGLSDVEGITTGQKLIF